MKVDVRIDGLSEDHPFEDRTAKRRPGEVIKKSILAMVVISATIVASIALSRIFGADGPSTGAPGGEAVRNGRIAYVSHSEEGAELWVVNPDGTEPVRLVGPIGKLPDRLSDPFWSPDGTRLGYNANLIGSTGIETINADGSDRQVISAGSLEYADSPDWSPDGQRIAFSYSDGRGGSGIHVMNADGTDVSRLTGDDLSAAMPSWSPDGTQIAFVVEDLSSSDTLNNFDIFVVNSDGSNVLRLTYDPHLDLEPDWSPDGTQILFRSRRDPAGGIGVESQNFPDEIYVMNSDGSNQRRLTLDEAVDQHPTWSPDGTMIAFHSLRDGLDGIYVMNSDGSGIRRVASGSMPAWQPLPRGEPRVSATPEPHQPSPSANPKVSEAPEAGAPEEAGWEIYRDEFGWSMAYPGGWRVQKFHEQTLATFRGALASNVDFEFNHPDLGEGSYTSQWDMRGLPPHAVVVQFQYLVRHFVTSDEPDTPFPFSLDRAERVRQDPAYGAPQPRLYLPVIVGGDPGYAVFAWFGPEASPRDRAIAERIVNSITFGAATTPGPPVGSPNPEGL
jgi:Tol biopolymer transport system component